ncbi:MAG: hypothetical protein M3N16_03075 [Actinomycetota bacterium]|nr:hypothetical protein [Actinomycetota bacterium]
MDPDFETSAARVVDGLVMADEEHALLSTEASPGALLARVVESLAQAAFGLSLLERPAKSTEAEVPTHEELAARFGMVAARALGAAARVHPGVRDDPPTDVKDRLLAVVDQDAQAWIDQHPNYGRHSLDYFLRTVLALMTGAAAAVADLEEEGGASVQREDEDPAEVYGDSLLQVAAAAAVAIERLLGAEGSD